MGRHFVPALFWPPKGPFTLAWPHEPIATHQELNIRICRPRLIAGIPLSFVLIGRLLFRHPSREIALIEESPTANKGLTLAGGLGSGKLLPRASERGVRRVPSSVM